MTDAFISYSREDQPVARRIAQQLAREGLSVWWDQELAAGEEFDRVTEQALDEARAVVVLWSTHSVSSRWVRAEATQAQAAGKLVPVMIEDCRRPIMFELTHAADLSMWQGDAKDPAWQSFTVGLRKTLARGATTEPVSAPPLRPPKPVGKPGSRARVAVAAAIVLALVAAGIGLRLPGGDSSQLAVPFSQALQQLADLVQSDSYSKAFTLGNSLLNRPEAKASAEFQELWQQVLLPMKPLVAEDGATVYFRPYDQPDGAWIKAGTTPLEELVPAPRGVLSIKVEKPGFHAGSFVVANPGPSVESDPSQVRGPRVPLPLMKEGALPAELVLVPAFRAGGGVDKIGLTNPSNPGNPEIPAFAIDRMEVSNRQFKEFVDAGGYEDPAYWKDLKFRKDGRELSWGEARKLFVDSTNRPGPLAWQLGSFLEGQADLPVGGISWYEAMAYARFRGKSLPTAYHWANASVGLNSGPDVPAAVAVSSQFNAPGPVAASSETGSGPWGTVNTAGNVREWVSNFVGSRALALGGAWSDYYTLAMIGYTADPMERLPENGMRLMQTLAGTGIGPELQAALGSTVLGTAGRSKPVSDEIFETIRYSFADGHEKPDSIARQQVEESPLWVAEEVRLKFADREEILYIARPRGVRGALQPVLYAPSADCCRAPRPNRDALQALSMPVVNAVVRSGRALVIPVWDGGYERHVGVPRNLQPDQWRRLLLSWHTSVTVTLDYLQQLSDMDAQRVGYLGVSYGSTYIAPSVLALEDRIQAAVLLSGGMARSGDDLPAMVDSSTYWPRVRIPVLMINGRFDNLFPLMPSQEAMFNLLPKENRDRRIYDVGHVNLPPNSTTSDIGDWFDKYLGPAR